MPPEPTQVTRLLQRMGAGDPQASGELMALLYSELRSLAGRFMADERAGHTLQPTALLNEAWIRLAGGGVLPTPNDRHHFVRLAAQAMRNILVDHARARGREKRGGGSSSVALDTVLALVEGRGGPDIVALSDALDQLGEIDERGARIVELRFFAGLSIAETAQVLGVSEPTVERSWRVARLFLSRALDGHQGP